MPAPTTLTLKRNVNMIIYTSDRVCPYVYLLTHKTTNEFYIGSRTTTKLSTPSHIDITNYKTSVPNIKARFDEFNWTILAEFFDPLDAYIFEQQTIAEHWHIPGRLNRCHYHNKGVFTHNRPHTPETRAKLKITQNLPEVKEKRVRGLKTWNSVPENKAKRLGRECTTETRSKISQSQLGRPLSQEHKQALKGPRPHVTPYNKGKTNMPPSHNTMWWLIKSEIDGTETKQLGLKRWCEQMGYNYQSAHHGACKNQRYKHYIITKV